MDAWIAFEHDERGLPSEACLIVLADSQAAAIELMVDAIRDEAAVAPDPQRNRIWDVFIEAPRQLPEDDPRATALRDHGRALFIGFEEPKHVARRASPGRRPSR